MPIQSGGLGVFFSSLKKIFLPQFKDAIEHLPSYFQYTLFFSVKRFVLICLLRKLKNGRQMALASQTLKQY